MSALEPAEPAEESRAEPVHTAPEIHAEPEVDLRGLTVEEALARLHPALDAAAAAGLAQFRIIHGKGTGALRQAVQEALAQEPRVRQFRLGAYYEGGAGVTIAELE